MFLLDAGCLPLRHNFPGFGPYLVGSAVTGERSAGTRDVDVRHIMRDEEYAAFVEAVGIEGVRFLGIAVGQYLASLTGLPIDFQFQQQTAANEVHGAIPEKVRHTHDEPIIGCRCAEYPANVTPAQPRSRNPLGVRSMGNFIGDGEPGTEEKR
jgi:hypothetical protein